MHQRLIDARKYEEENGSRIAPEERPLFHLTPKCGWMNDPNGFSYYKGKFHMFYQYNPYESHWGPMHWGHAISDDLLHWTYLPCALAPDMYYDKDGVFSGSAAVLPDGRQLLVYTGVCREELPDKNFREWQTQCLAVGDGVEYEKYEGNPVIDSKKLPTDASTKDFRDPRIMMTENGEYDLVAANRTMDDNGQILLYHSKDGFHWKFETVLLRGDGRFGLMWECPDYFELDGKHVILTSPQDMLPQGFEYHSGNGTLCLIGHFDPERKVFSEEHDQSIDYGVDFYAAQTVLAPDGRRIMIGWMQNWDACSIRDEDAPWAGQMSLPRELWIEDGRLYQRPTREFDAMRAGKVSYRGLSLSEGDRTRLEGIYGRTLDMELKIQVPKDSETRRVVIRFAEGERFYTSLIYQPQEQILMMDRKFSGSRRAIVHQRRCRIDKGDKELHLRIILDRFSAEVFVNHGRQVMTMTLYTPLAANGISFESVGGRTVIDIDKFEICSGGEQ